MSFISCLVKAPTHSVYFHTSISLPRQYPSNGWRSWSANVSLMGRRDTMSFLSTDLISEKSVYHVSWLDWASSISCDRSSHDVHSMLTSSPSELVTRYSLLNLLNMWLKCSSFISSADVFCRSCHADFSPSPMCSLNVSPSELCWSKR